LTIKKRFFKLIRVFGRDELFAEAYPCGVGGGMDYRHIDKGGVVDAVIFDEGDFDAGLSRVFFVDRAAFLDGDGSRP
jgi:hypothetical protein